ncbi:Diaminopimelate epimerase-like protein [Lepidopterella palustris CBS 459.81]|uniref:Diaminopimelate epimerase-like protein n=1 Tax=Lepidopterella palustris CBS 459.81 TaxID=1314670 RepID=A0A8E2EI87_9PEZI|nr:Diaminopimelate epimerase-like protein [Lepidopterella palustris CBS 459.81]
MPILDFVIVDVFTQNKYEGNPLAIVKIPKSSPLSQDEKQAIAREFNLSETAFVHEHGPEGHHYEWTVDIFMTNKELPFAGHPTIGTACHVLSEIAKSHESKDIIEAKFKIKAGKIDLRYIVAEKVVKAAIPHNVHIHKNHYGRESLLSIQTGLAKAGRSGIHGLKEQSDVVSVVRGMTFVVVQLEDEEALKAVSTTATVVEFDGLDEGWGPSFVGLYFFVRLGESEDGTVMLRTRMIEGPLEDPATGSAASALAGYLSLKEGKPGQALKYAMTQGVEMGRRSNIGVEVVMAESDGIDTINLVGGAVQVMEGRLVV